MTAALVAIGKGGVSTEFALCLTERQQLAYYIAIGEQKGGEWDYELMNWATPPQPDPVFAVPAEMGGTS